MFYRLAHLAQCEQKDRESEKATDDQCPADEEYAATTRHEFVRHIMGKFESVTVVLLLPLFFAFSGLRTNIGLVQGGGMWRYCGLIVVVAVAGKLGGAALAARASGSSWRAERRSLRLRKTGLP